MSKWPQLFLHFSFIWLAGLCWKKVLHQEQCSCGWALCWMFRSILSWVRPPLASIEDIIKILSTSTLRTWRRLASIPEILHISAIKICKLSQSHYLWVPACGLCTMTIWYPAVGVFLLQAIRPHCTVLPLPWYGESDQFPNICNTFLMPRYLHPWLIILSQPAPAYLISSSGCWMFILSRSVVHS